MSKLPPILLVDDDRDALFLGKRILARTGLANPIVTAPGGDESIALLRRCCLPAGGRRSHKPAVVLLDINMPITDGFKVLGWLKKKRAFARTRVIMLTSSDHPADHRRALELGADAIVIKYPSPIVFAGLLRTALRNGSSRSRSLTR